MWIYDQGEDLKVFATEEAAQAWIEENDPEGVAFEYEVIGRQREPAAFSRDSHTHPRPSGCCPKFDSSSVSFETFTASLSADDITRRATMGGASGGPGASIASPGAPGVVPCDSQKLVQEHRSR